MGKGTIFFDEVGSSMAPELQAALLGVLKTGTFRPLGTTKDLKFKGRIICATNSDLQRQVREGLFCNDLYYRLAQGNILIPPLRKRPEDLRILIKLLLKKINPKAKLSAVALSKLMKNPLPGNTHELLGILTMANLMANLPSEASAPTIEASDIQGVEPESEATGPEQEGVRKGWIGTFNYEFT